MAHQVCPRCGGHAQVEAESWSSGDDLLTRSLRCDSCGDRSTVTARIGQGPPWSVRGRSARLPALIPLAFLAVWIILKLLPYADRAQIYAGVSSALEAYRNPVWAGAACIAAILLLTRAARRARDVVPGPGSVADVHVREESGGRLAFLLPGERGAVGRDFIVERDLEQERVLIDRFAELAARSGAFSTHPAAEQVVEVQREMHALGLSLADAILGRERELRERLFALKGDHLLLRIQPSLAALPWELIVPGPGAQFLWQQFHVARQIRADESTPRAALRETGPTRVLVLADLEAGDPERALPEASREASELMELAALEPDRLRVTRRSPRSADELRRALAEGFDVVHFAGHTRAADGTEGWVIADGKAVDPGSALAASGYPPVLAFANACHSGPGAGRSDWSSAAPRRLMAAGVAAYVGTMWELEDAGAASFARTFYRNVASGRTLGESVTAARASRMGTSPFTWANYVLYGDPTLRLQKRF